MKCPKCGTENSGSAKFCEECGTKLEVIKKCKSCSTVLTANARFCPNCGTPVNGDARPAAKAMPGNGVSFGEKNVIAGDVSVTNVSQSTDTNTSIMCSICGKRVLIADSVHCRICGRDVCQDCFDEENRMCASCSAEKVKQAEQEYKAKFLELYDDGIINFQERKELNSLKARLNLSDAKVAAIENSVKGKSAPATNELTRIEKELLKKAQDALCCFNYQGAFDGVKDFYKNYLDNEEIVLTALIPQIMLKKEYAVEELYRNNQNIDSLGLTVAYILSLIEKKDLINAEKQLNKANSTWQNNPLLERLSVVLNFASFEEFNDEEYLKDNAKILQNIPNPANAIEQWLDKYIYSEKIYSGNKAVFDVLKPLIESAAKNGNSGAQCVLEKQKEIERIQEEERLKQEDEKRRQEEEYARRISEIVKNARENSAGSEKITCDPDKIAQIYFREGDRVDPNYVVAKSSDEKELVSRIGGIFHNCSDENKTENGKHVIAEIFYNASEKKEFEVRESQRKKLLTRNVFIAASLRILGFAIACLSIIISLYYYINRNEYRNYTLLRWVGYFISISGILYGHKKIPKRPNKILTNIFLVFWSIIIFLHKSYDPRGFTEIGIVNLLAEVLKFNSVPLICAYLSFRLRGNWFTKFYILQGICFALLFKIKKYKFPVFILISEIIFLVITFIWQLCHPNIGHIGFYLVILIVYLKFSGIIGYICENYNDFYSEMIAAFKDSDKPDNEDVHRTAIQDVLDA